jgi:hypothetical protein
MYFSFRKIRLTVAGDQPFRIRRRPRIHSAFSAFTMAVIAFPSLNSLKILWTMVASVGSTVIR